MNRKLFFMLLLSSICFANLLKAQDPYIGEIRMFAGNFAPQGWAKCEGQLLSIQQNAALFSILGTTYGGNGTTNFALPDLRGRIPMAPGAGPGLTPHVIGEASGSENTQITVANLPAHTHAMTGNSAAGTSSDPTNNYPANTGAVDKEYGTSPNVSMGITQPTGNNVPINNVQPYLCVTFIIAIQGIYPTQ